jgi:peptidoglycan hydrolase-like protein with peptidoglycan-binding domain
MTDVFICYSREDRERVRPIAEGLQAEGWDVWWDPGAPLQGENDSVDRQLGSAGAVLVVWSAASRASEYVRSEAATGLYKNKLIQVRIDSAHPPRPFDQVEVLDLGAWSGDRDDAGWRRVIGAARLFAGSPGSERPQVMRRAARAAPPPVESDDIPDDYLEPRGGITVGPLIAAAALLVIGAGFWILDPLGWRKPRTDSETAGAASIAAPVRTATSAAKGAPLAAPSGTDTPASEIAWAKANRDSPVELRGLLAAYPGTNAAESARSLLRVLDAQGWADAVTADTEKAYTAYIQSFPANADIPGAMVAAAQERLASLASERSQAIADVQRALAASKTYRGKVDGQPGEGTIRAVRGFAQSHNRPMIELKSAAPRDLRAFADLVNAESGRPAPQANAASIVSAPAPAAIPAEPASRPAPTPPPPKPAATPPAAPSAASTAAAAADRARLQQAEEARKAAQKQAAENLASAELLRKDAADWSDAKALNTAPAYQAYLAAHPNGATVADAHAAIARLARPAAYAVTQLAPQVRQAVESARQVQVTATARAAAARNTAARADAVAAAARSGSAGTQILTAADGARYESQVSAGAPNGLGVKVSSGAARGDKYRGELRSGLGVGLGVYEFADNPNNAQSGALRYEGEHANDQANGLGMTYWKNGDTFAGQETAGGAGRGVMTFANGQRYDGEMTNGKRNGYGVVWSADGQVVMAGRFENGALVEPMAPPAQ